MKTYLLKIILLVIFLSGTLCQVFGQSNVNSAEYFIDTDPGFGNGNSISLSPGTDISSTFSPDLSGVSTGAHKLEIRAQDANGNWSITSHYYFFKEDINIDSVRPAAYPLESFEYFFDTDPGFGNGHTVSLQAKNTTDLQDYQFTTDISSLSEGNHVLYIRAKDDWGITAAYSFTISGTVTPVKIISFNGIAAKNRVELTWKTGSEQNNDYFDIEHSVDGVNFTKIGTVKGHGTTSSTLNYSFDDNNPAYNTINYYRLKQVDYDGHFTYSNVIALRFDGGPLTLSVYPNPVSNVLHIGIPTQEQEVGLIITDESGKVMLRNEYQHPDNIISLDVSKLVPGVYNITVIRSGNRKTSLQFIKR